MKRLVAYHSFRLLLILPNYPVSIVQILGSDSFVIFSLLSVILHCNCGGHRSQTLIWSRYCWLTAGARMGSGWWCRNVICISMSRHSSRCFVAYSFEIRRHNFHRKDKNTGRRLLVREGCIMRFEEGVVLSLGTPPLVAAVASVAEVVFWHLKRSVLISNNNARENVGHIMRWGQ